MLVENNTTLHDEETCKEVNDGLSNNKSGSCSSNDSNTMAICTEVYDEFFYDSFVDDDVDIDDDNDLDSLDVLSWSITSSAHATPCDDLDTIKEKQDLLTTPSSNMDGRMQKCLYDIPHTITMKLIRSLDTDSGWENLAAASGFNFEDICELRQEERKMNGSPTRSLLWKLGCRAYTMQMLHDKLIEIDRITDAEVVAFYIMEGDKRSRPSPPIYMVSPSKHSDSLQNYISRMSLSSTNPPNQQPMFGASYHPSAAGSEVNFNNQSMADTSQTKLAHGFKLYEDKFIPGAKSTSTYPNPGQAMAPTFVSSQYSIPSSSSSSSSNNNNNNNGYHPSAMEPLPFPTGSSYRADMPTRVLRDVAPTASASLMSSQSHAQVAMSIKAAFSYEELVAATDQFSEGNILGEGGFGKVYKGHLRHLDCAVKRFIKKKAEDNQESTEQIHSEMAALLKYQHENIVTLYGYALDGPQLCLVYQYLSNGSLEDRLMRKNNTPALSWERRLNILVGSCRAISFLHTMGSEPLIHGDVKSANILLDSHLEAKFADLGQSRYATNRSSNTGGLTHITMDQTASRQYGSTAYQAPEIKACCSISMQSDIYAMGVVMLEICSGKPAYDCGRNENKFLTDLYTDHIAKLNESSRIQEFKDKTPPDFIHDSTFLSVLKLASQCINEIKKLRPKSGKLIKTVKQIYDDQYKELKRLNSPTEDDASVTPLSNYHSHMSERVVSNELNSPAPRTQQQQPPQQMPSIVQMQEEVINQYSLKHQQNNPQSHQQPNYLPNSTTSTTTNSKVPVCANMTRPSEPKSCYAHSNPSMPSNGPFDKNKAAYLSQSSMSSSPAQSPTPSTQPPISHLHNMPPNKSLPESFILQQHYDYQQVSGQGMSHSKENQSHSDSTTTMPVRNPVEQGEVVKPGSDNVQSSLVSDPRKLAAMKVFDELGFHSDNRSDTNRGDNSVDNSSSGVSLKCDEAKLAYLKDFDDNVFKSARPGGNNANSADRVGDNGNVKDCSSNCGVGTAERNSHVTQQNVKDEVIRNGDDNIRSSEQICNSCTNPKELEALGQQQRQDFLPQSHEYNSRVEVDSDPSPPHSHQTRPDSGCRSGETNISARRDTLTGKKEACGSVPSNTGNSHEQRLANRENMFMCYNEEQDDDDDDGEEGDEYDEEEYV